nr:uncharacterized protein CI109_006586 [Kwoniella shandongensis]KAA5525124.1 hypothetical protein CI109_006586 [Kwoniella shandongensis]
MSASSDSTIEQIHDEFLKAVNKKVTKLDEMEKSGGSSNTGGSSKSGSKASGSGFTAAASSAPSSKYRPDDPYRVNKIR